MKSKHTITLREVLNRPLFLNAKLVAGKKGIIRKVGWVHILEITTAASFINKDDLILTTGLGLHQNKNDRLRYMKELIDQDAAGLCVELGTYLPAIPQDMIDLANQYDFPLISFHSTVRFVDITQDIHSLIINQQHQILKDLELFSRKLQQLTLQSTDIRPILRLLHEQTSYQVIYHSLIEKNKFVPSVSIEMGKDLIHRYQNELEQKHDSSLEPQILLINKTVRILSQPIICLGETLSYIGLILHDTEPSESLLLLLDYVGQAIAHILLRKLFLEEKTLENHHLLITDILQEKINNEEQALARIGLPPLLNGGYQFIAGIIEIKHLLMKTGETETQSKNQDTLVLLRSLLKKQGIFSLLMPKNNHIYILCIKELFDQSSPSPVLKKCLVQILEQLQHSMNRSSLEGIEIIGGFGRTKCRIGEAYQSFKEASDTLEVARKLPLAKIPFYEDLGIYQILISISDQEMLSSFVAHYLGPIIDFDRKNNSELLQTLDEYLKCRGAKQETADRLFIHRQTLYHRLDKITDLIGHDFLESQNRICLEFALHAFHIVSIPTLEYA